MSSPSPQDGIRGPRIVFFLQGQRVPASRVRGIQIAQALAASGFDLDLRACSPSVYGDTNLPLPFRNWRALFYPAALISRLWQLRGLRQDDIIFFQRPMFEWPFTALEKWATRGRKAIFDFDDAIYLNRFGLTKLRRIVDLVDHVVAGNHTLAKAAHAPEKTTVIPTVIDTDRFVPQPTRMTRGREVLVGWTGLSCNYQQLAIAKTGIAAALRKTGARFRVICDRPPPAFLDELNPEFVPWSPTSEVDDLRALDVGVMPLPPSPHACGKCSFKLLQYMGLGLPGIASPVGTNAEVLAGEKVGFLADHDDAWEHRLTELIESPETRLAMGQAARARVMASYSIQAVLPRYLAIFAGLNPALNRQKNQGDRV